MGERQPLAEVLQRYLTEGGYTPKGLAQATEERYTLAVPYKTIDHWCHGRATRVHNDEQLLKVAATLGLNRVRTTRLLAAAGKPPIDALLAQARDPARLALLAPWATTHAHNLPAPLTTFVGRDEEILDHAEALSGREVRLLTLTGPGGSGKTRLALRVAEALLDSFADGVWFVPLAAMRDPALVLPTIARTLGLIQPEGTALDARLAERLRDRRLLLLVDNLEQVVASGPALTGLLVRAPGLKILLTSRVPLHLSGEYERAVLPLPPPRHETSVARLRANPAVELFVRRAQAVDPAFALTSERARTVAALCTRLDGLPLAIELAAARLRDRAPQALLLDFQGRLDLAADGPRDAPARHRTLRATIGWSVELLPPPVRQLFAQLAVFAGGGTSEAILAVCGDGTATGAAIASGLATLRDASLLNFAQGGGDTTGRYAMLETIREDAAERLAASGEAEALQRRHVAWCIEAIRPPGRYFPTGAHQPWLDAAAAELDNLRAALAWAQDEGEGTLLVELVAAAWPLWHERAAYAEAGRWLILVLPMAEQLPRALRATLLTGAAMLALGAGDAARAADHAAGALALWEASDEPYWQAFVHLYLALARQNRGDLAGAGDAYARSLALWRAVGDPRGLARCLADLALARALYADFPAAEQAATEALALYRSLGDRVGEARLLTDGGLTLMLQGRLPEACASLQRGVDLSRTARATHNLPHALCYLGLTTLLAGDLPTARAALTEALGLARDTNEGIILIYGLIGLAGVARRVGAPGRAARLCGVAATLHAAGGASMPPGPRTVYEGELAQVRAALGEAAFAAAWAEGLAMPLDAAVALALDDPPPPASSGQG